MRRAFLGAFTGSSPMRSSTRARQKGAAGHLSHWGAPLGRQTVAPSSIMAWLKFPGSPAGMTAWRAVVTFFFMAGEVMSPLSPVIRAATRSTFPSTAGTGMPKAMEAMAPAV